MRLTIEYPDNFCGCVRFKSDVVSYAEFDWDGVDVLKNLRFTLGFE